METFVLLGNRADIASRNANAVRMAVTSRELADSYPDHCADQSCMISNLQEPAILNPERRLNTRPTRSAGFTFRKG